ncbi:hypothetical protein SEVIR_7G091300v4 [Setaria viridis]
MAVQARHLPHDFPPVGGSLFFDEYAGCVPTAPAGMVTDTTLLSDLPGSELTGNYGFVPRKRARVGVADSRGSFSDLEDQRVALSPPAAMQGLLPLPVAVGDAQSRTMGSGAASTSGRAANGATLSFSHLGGEIDALIRHESERMRAGLEEARRRHARALLAAAARAATGWLRAAEAEVEHALRRNAELEEKARQMAAECQAWMGVARSHEAVGAGLRATLDQLLQSPSCAAALVGDVGEAEDARSCCFEAAPPPAAAARSCRSCGGGEACVLLLPCRHLCLCRACEAGVDACPVCAAAKNASLLVLVS